MEREEYEKWLKDAMTCLMVKYTKEQAEVVVDWFKRIRGSDERDLIGSERVDHFLACMPDKYWSVYDSMMARLWIYAPYILEEEGMAPMLKISSCAITCMEQKQGRVACEKKCRYIREN